MATSAPVLTEIESEYGTDEFGERSTELVDEVLVIKGAVYDEQIPLLRCHKRDDTDNQSGSVSSIRKRDDLLDGELRFSSDDFSERDWIKVKEGHLRGVSVGFERNEWVDLRPGEERTIDGRTYAAGERKLRLTTSWTVKELSLTPIGADPNAIIRKDPAMAATVRRAKTKAKPKQARTLSGRAKREEGLAAGEDEVRNRRSVRAKREDAVDDEEREDVLDDEEREDAVVEEEREDAVVEEEREDAIDEEEREDAVDDEEREDAVDDEVDEEVRVSRRTSSSQFATRAERRRIMGIQRAGRGMPRQLISRAISQGLTLTQAKGLFYDHTRSSRPTTYTAGGPAIHTASGVTRGALTAGVLHRVATHDQIERIRQNPRLFVGRDNPLQLSDRALDAGHEYRDLSMVDLARECLRADGITPPRNRSELFRVALSPQLVGRAMSQSTFVGVFSTNVNATVIAMYQEAPSTIGWVRMVDVQDFRTNDVIRLEKGGAMARLARGHQAAHTTFSDNLVQYKIHRFAAQYQVDEQDLIDDRFDLIPQFAQEGAMAASRIPQDMVYYLLLSNSRVGPTMGDGVSLFHASHGNYASSSSAMTAATVQAGFTAMGKQAENGVNLNLTPKYYLVPQDLRFTGEIIFASAARFDGASASNQTASGTANPLLNLAMPVVDNRLGTAGVTDPITGVTATGKATGWYLVADPAVAPTIQVAYLRDTGRAPQTRQWTFDRDGRFGMGWDVKLDVGIAALDHRGLYYDDGDA